MSSARSKILQFLFFLSLLLSSFSNLNGQYICRYTFYPGSTIAVWDWTKPVFTMYYKNADGDDVVDDNVISPFYDLTPNAAPNVEHLQIYAPDFEPADGWELLTKNFGGPVEGQPGVTEYVQTPTFALYNRHSGLVRVLTYIPTNSSSSFDIVRSSAGYNIGNSGSVFENGSAIFSFMKTPAPALDRFDPFGDVANSYNLYVDGGVWTILDFIAAYDPCVCFYPSAIKFLPTLRDTQSMTLHLEAQGITAPIIQNGQPASALQQGFKVAENGLGVLGAGVKSFNSLNNYYSTVNDLVPATAPPGDLIPATGGSSLTVLKNLLPAWVDATGTFVKLLKFLVGKKGNAVPTKIVGYSSAFQITGSATTSNSELGNGTTIFTPNSEAATSPDVQDGSDPVYQNPLGIFNLVRTPVITRQVNQNPQVLGRTFDEYYSLQEPLQYVVNTTGDLKLEPSRLMLALAARDCQGDLAAMRLLTPTQGGIVRTPLVDASCFENQYINFFSLFESDDITSFEQNLCGGAFTLHIFARLVPNDGSDEVVFMGEFEVEIAEAKTIDAPLPFTGFSNDLQAADGCQNGVLPPISYQELVRFCQEEYDPTPKKDNRSDDNPQPDNKPSLPEGLFYPNPFSTHLAYQVTDQKEPPSKVELFDMAGQLVLSRSTDLVMGTEGQEHIFSLTQLAPGTYIAKVFYETTIETHKLIKL